MKGTSYVDAALVLGPLATLVAEAVLGWTAIAAQRRKNAAVGTDATESLPELTGAH